MRRDPDNDFVKRLRMGRAAGRTPPMKIARFWNCAGPFTVDDVQMPAEPGTCPSQPDTCT
jgi:hypothetical protein